MLKISQYPRNADGTPMDLEVGVLTDETGNGGARLANAPVGPDGSPIDARAIVLVDDGGYLVIPESKVRLTPDNSRFGAKRYDPNNLVDAADALNAFFVHAQDPVNARKYTYDWFGEWYILKPVYALYTSSDPDVRRHFICGTLRVGDKSLLPGGVAMFAVFTMASIMADWAGVITVNEHGTHPYSGNTTYNTRRYRHGVHITFFGSSTIENPISVDCSIREGVLLEGHEAGTVINGTVLGGQSSIGCRIGGVIGRYCGTHYYDAVQAPTPLIVNALSHGGTAAGVPFSNTEGFTAGTGGYVNSDSQRTKITVGGGTTTADLEIDDVVMGRVELTPTIYGTIAAAADVDPRTGTFTWSAGDPTNLDGAGNGLKVGDIYPIFQAGPNIGNEYVITGFSGGSNRTIAVAAKEIYNTGIVITAHAATADPTYKQYGPWSVHWVTRVIDANNFTVVPWYPARLNSTIRIHHGGALHAEGEDLANIVIGSVIAQFGSYAYYCRANFAPTIQTVLAESCGTYARIGDPNYGGGLGYQVKHGHSEANLFDAIVGSTFNGELNISSYSTGSAARINVYTPRAATNDMTPAIPRSMGNVRVTLADGVTFEPASGGTRESASGQNFISNAPLYRFLECDGGFNVEVRYDEEVADHFVKYNYADVVVMANNGNPVGGVITFTLSKKLQAQGWLFDPQHGGGVSWAAAYTGSAYSLRFIYFAANKRIGVLRSQYFLDYQGDLRAPANLYIGELSSGAGYVDNKELVLRNSSGFGLRVVVNGSSSDLYIQNYKVGVGFADIYLQTPNLRVDSGNLLLSGNFTTSGGYIGYAAGAGGAVAQLTSKTTAATLNKVCGQFTTNNAALAAGAAVTFQVNNSFIQATDYIGLNLQGGHATDNTYDYKIERVAAGSFKVTIKNISGGSLSEALTFNFVAIHAVNA